MMKNIMPMLFVWITFSWMILWVWGFAYINNNILLKWAWYNAPINFTLVVIALVGFVHIINLVDDYYSKKIKKGDL
jgi:hypothetical protein